MHLVVDEDILARPWKRYLARLNSDLLINRPILITLT
jgi:hypothetical protein